jgi:hypothetical protein
MKPRPVDQILEQWRERERLVEEVRQLIDEVRLKPPV